jgi:hypothetical protein
MTLSSSAAAETTLGGAVSAALDNFIGVPLAMAAAFRWSGAGSVILPDASTFLAASALLAALAPVGGGGAIPSIL